MLHGAEVDSLFDVIPAGLVVGFVASSGAWIVGWLLGQILAFVRRVR